MLSFESLKTGFAQYLKNYEKKHPSKKYNIEDESKSIFMYSKELKEYLVKELNCDTSIYTKSLNDILSMQIVNGKLVEADSKEAKEDKKSVSSQSLKETIEEEEKAAQDALSAENSDITAMAEVEEGVDNILAEKGISTEDEELADEGAVKKDAVSLEEGKGGTEDKQITSNLNEAQEETQEQDLLTGLLNELMEDADFKKAIDSDEDDEITDEELAAFLGSIKGNDENEQDISIDDILVAIDKIKNNDVEEGKGGVEDDETDDKDKTTDKDKESTQNSGKTGSSGGSSGSTPTSAATPAGTTPTGIANPASAGKTEQLPKTDSNGNPIWDNMSVDEIQKELDSRIADNTELKEAYNNAIENAQKFDQEKEVTEAKEKADELYDAYKEAMKDKVDEQTQQEIDAKKQAIDQTQAEVDKADIDIAAAKSNLELAQNKLANAETTLSNLDAKLSELEAANKDGSLDETIAELKEAKEAAQAEKDAAQAEVEAQQAAVVELETTKATKEGELETLKAKLQELQTKAEENDEDGSIKEAREAWEEAQKAYEEKKDASKQEGIDNIKTAKDNLKESDNSVSEAKNELYKAKAKEAINQNTVPQELKNAVDGKCGEGFCAKVAEIAKSLNCSPVDLLAIMNSESGINPAARNAEYGATGLIQFMPQTAQEVLGVSTDQLAQMSAIEQLDYVKKYYDYWKNVTKYPADQKMNAGDLYTLTFLPAKVNQEELCSSGSKSYDVNKGLDFDGDGVITKTDLKNHTYKLLASKYGIQL